ncbi:pyridoxal 5'-phosphate synthase glutaminase subunit PdxT [Microbacterium sp. NC79]|uniref:pyridoxal 5'-phosphate synthase glutaminase subunit PdxT n=1 Tax=Microbacterium sp. NC79 TaxID=2851009 RepID=UPI001C2C6810|nr:pyridoxal 5'-phosphate synthase glutaminase subunit PdxT [Microbacterium sp. NC79]MBV0894957.1 pyridoxal 5'-phosphate synthase glutaminase subunit PdxT [Microbacterium sp. NC79]
MVTTTVGVLALQGGVSEHTAMLEQVGVQTLRVRRAEDLDGIDGLVIPGGESGVIDRLTRIFGLAAPLRLAIAGGLPVLGTCAGLIMLADRVANAAPGQQTLGGLDITVERNAFGSQRDSFDTTVSVVGVGNIDASFIRAPIVTAVGDGVDVIATLPDGRVVGVRSGALMGVSFHPEVAGDPRVHEAFVRTIIGNGRN